MMNVDDIDRALREEASIAPSPDFAARVMRTVRSEALDPGPIPFPWRRVIPGVMVCSTAIVVGVVVLGPQSVVGAVGRSLRVIPLEIVVAALTPLAGSWCLARIGRRLAGCDG